MVQMRGSRNFHQGGGGGKGPGQSDKKALTTIFLVLSLFYRSQMVNFKEIYRFSRLQMGSNFFQGVQLFPGGVQLLIPYRNPLNLWFSRGGPDPCPPPLWIHTWCSPHSFMVKATIHYLIWAWQTLIDRRMYHHFIVIYHIISVYYRNLRCFNRWQLYILFNNVSYIGWSLTNHWLRSSIASTFSIATYPVCVLIQWIRNQNNLKQELGVIYIFSHVSVEKKVCFLTG